MKSNTVLSMFFVMYAAILSPAWCEDTVKIVVLPLDFRNHSNSGPDIGKEISSLIASKLSDEGIYTALVVETSSDSGSFETARGQNLDRDLDIAHQKGADFALIGSVQQFDLVLGSVTSSRLGALSVGRGLPAMRYSNAIAGVLDAMSANMANRGKVKASIELKLINAATGDVVLTMSGAGESRHLTTTLWDHHQNFTDVSSKEFIATPAGEAMYATIEPICAQLRDSFQNLSNVATSFRVRGTIQDIDDTCICLDFGKKDKLDVGTTLTIDRPVVSVSGGQKPLVGRGLTMPIGTIVVTDVGDNVSLAKPSSGVAPAIGDYIRSRSADMAIEDYKPVEEIGRSNRDKMSSQSKRRAASTRVLLRTSSGDTPN